MVFASVFLATVSTSASGATQRISPPKRTACQLLTVREISRVVKRSAALTSSPGFFQAGRGAAGVRVLTSICSWLLSGPVQGELGPSASLIYSAFETRKATRAEFAVVKGRMAATGWRRVKLGEAAVVNPGIGTLLVRQGTRLIDVQLSAVPDAAPKLTQLGRFALPRTRDRR